MTKRILTLALVAAGFSLVSCSSEPSDLRPNKKVSVDVVPPGTRSTNNLDNAADNSEHDQKKHDVMINHDAGANKLKGSGPTSEHEVANDADSVKRHE